VSIQQRLETLALTTTMALPERVQRLLAGKPVLIDGQTLAPEIQLMLRLQRLARMPGAETLPFPEARTLVDTQAVMAGGSQPIGAVRDFEAAGIPMRLYTPTGAADPTPMLVFFHGGGFMYGSLDSHDASCRLLAEEAGARVLSVDYRMAPEHVFPAGHEDAVTAYRWAVDNAASLGADPARLAVGGDSAGGNLAAYVALEAARADLPLAFQLLVYPITDVAATTRSRGLFADGFYLTADFIDLANRTYAADPADPRISVLHADLPAGLAPAYVATAGFDPLRDEGEAYSRKLADAGLSVELQRFPDLIHSFFNLVGVGRRSPAAVREMAGKLRAGLAAGER